MAGEVEIDRCVLNKVEKEYLENLIGPFKNIVSCIAKGNEKENQQFVLIYCNTGDFIFLPNFPKGTAFKGMKTEKYYSLKELGLFENE